MKMHSAVNSDLYISSYIKYMYLISCS